MSQPPSLKEMKEAEETLISLSGLKLGPEIQTFDVKISDNPLHFIHTCSASGSSVLPVPPIVFLHGFGSTNCAFLPFFKELKDAFRLYSIDLPGMNLSTRVPFLAKTPEEALEYFTGSIEQWRIAMNLDSFALVGVSFGGLIAGHYTKLYQNRVSQLVVISPAGFSPIPNHSGADSKPRQDPGPSSMPINLKFNDFLRKRELTPSDFVRKTGPFAKLLINHVIFGSRIPNKEIREAVQKYYYHSMRLPVAGEKGIQILLDRGKYSPMPLVDVFCDPMWQTPTTIFSGDKDWNSYEPFKGMAARNPALFRYVSVLNASHSLHRENPKPVCDFLRMKLTQKIENEEEKSSS